MRFFTVALLAASALLAGCAGGRLGGSPNVRVVEGNQLPPPTLQDLAAATRPYLLGPLDRLSVEVFGVADLNRALQVDAAGNISLPLAGTIQVAGLTPTQVEDLVEERLRGRYIRDPQVTVNLTDALSQHVTVEGEVDEPGIYPILGRMTLMRAIARAKGTTEFARRQHVVVFRTVGGQNMAALYDLRAIQLGAYDDPEVYANDIVVVSEDRARRIFRDVLQSGGLITTPLVALLQNGN
jgi:polysaccharide export outer membrane protein